MSATDITVPDKLVPVFEGPADVRGAHGGRGSAKTRTFAMMTAVWAHMFDQQGLEGIILCGRQWQNSLDDSSLAEVKAAIRSVPYLEAWFDIGETYIRTKSGRISYSFVGLERNINSIKSKSRILLAWVEEAEDVTEVAWQVLIPTLREEVSELWVTWNPKRKKSATNQRFRDNPDPRYKVVEMNWRDNPWFPTVLQRTRLRDQQERPDDYEHVWEGAYATTRSGAYYAASLTAARLQGRVGRVGADPVLTYRAFCDIGGTGAKADAFTIWVAQFVGLEIRVLDYYEAVGQPAAAHIQWLRERSYSGANTTIWLPHDGDQQDKVFDTSYRKAFTDAGYSTEVVPNQGKGAAKSRIEAVRRVFPRVWFNEETTSGGIEALGWYHEKHDADRDIGLGPEHDWASHGADAFGLLAVVAETSGTNVKALEPIKYKRRFIA